MYIASFHSLNYILEKYDEFMNIYGYEGRAGGMDALNKHKKNNCSI